jgi:DUF1680 family protein
MYLANNQEIVQSDIQNLYLGNLRTVEFNLNLPTQGKSGSTISWATSDERFIEADGTVHRPSYGRGNRVVTLTATFSQGDYSEQVAYPVNVLEEANDIVITKIYPVELTQELNETFYLPQAVAVETENGKTLPQYVKWDGGEKRSYEQPGTYEVRGHIDASDYEVTGHVKVQAEVQKHSNREKVVSWFPLSAVRLTPGTPAAIAQQKRLEFLRGVDDDQMLYNFRAAAGLDTKGAPEMIGWDTPDSLLRGHTTGHYLSALAQAYAATGDATVLAKLHYMVESLAEVQAAFAGQPGIHDGFLSAYNEDQFDLLEKFTPYPQIWAPYYTLHKILAGLLDAYQLADSAEALSIATKIGHWVYNRLSRLDPVHRKKMWAMYIAGEIGGINESLAKLGEITGEAELVQAAQYFDNDKLFFPLQQHVDALGSMHANQHIPQVIGAITLYGATKEERYYQIANFFWQSVTGHHIYSFGGTGDGEMFQQPDEIGTKLNENSAESCASYNMLKLTTDLYQYEPTADKMAYYENTLINHILSSTDHEGLGASTYFMPTEPGGVKGFDDENSCCHGTGLESQFKYGEAIFAQSADQVYVNLFIPAHLATPETDLTIRGDFGTPEHATIKVTRLAKKLAIRQPAWSAQMSVVVNGQPVTMRVSDHYDVIETPLKPGDEITLTFTPALHLFRTPDKPELASVAFGPYILAALSDQSDYIDLGVATDADLAAKLVRVPNSASFTADGLRFVPFYSVNHEPYSVYFKTAVPATV